MHLASFANPWEHIRLLSDAARNRALLTLLGRHAKGHRVLEVGCGTGMLSLAAARMGASRVHAVEPTPMADLAQELVRRNGLQDIVIVHPARIEEIDPHPVDLAFFELFNADPFVEGVVPVAQATRPWLAPGGRMAPRRLEIWAALCASTATVQEATAAVDELTRIAASLDLDLAPLLATLHPNETSKDIAADLPLSAPTLIWSLDMLHDEQPEDAEVHALVATQDAEVGGVMVWFEAELDDGLRMSNQPGVPNHWGQLVAGFSRPSFVLAGESIEVEFELDDDELEVRLAPR